MALTPRFSFKLADGSVITGVVQGSGGPLTSRSVIQAHQRRARRGLSIRGYEPKPGHVLVFPNFSAKGNGAGVEIDLRSSVLLD